MTRAFQTLSATMPIHRTSLITKGFLSAKSVHLRIGFSQDSYLLTSKSESCNIEL